MNIQPIADKNLIYKIRSGSDLYGTTIHGKSDTDYLGVFIPTKDFILGTYRVEQYIERSNSSGSGKANTNLDYDYTCYALPKFIHLLELNNPTILETLFASENCRLYSNEFGKRLVESRDLFVSLKVKWSFGGYAFSQRQKMILTENKTGERWNELAHQLGYEPKFASHTIRLLYFGIQLLKEGTLTLPTRYSGLLADIKLGKYTHAQVEEMCNQLNNNLEQAYLSSSLPAAPDKKKVSDFQRDMIETFWHCGTQRNSE